MIVEGCSAGNTFPLKKIEYFLRNKETSTRTRAERAAIKQEEKVQDRVLQNYLNLVRSVVMKMVNI